MKGIKVTQIDKEICDGWCLVKINGDTLDITNCLKIVLDDEKTEFKQVAAIRPNYLNEISDCGHRAEDFEAPEVIFTYDIKCFDCHKFHTVHKKYKIDCLDAEDRIYNNVCPIDCEHKTSPDDFNIIKRKIEPIKLPEKSINACRDGACGYLECRLNNMLRVINLIVLGRIV